MNPALQEILGLWNNVGIVAAFLAALNKGIDSLKAWRRGPLPLQGPTALAEAFFRQDIEYAAQVTLPGRLSRCSPIYVPIAYSPQALKALPDPAGREGYTMIENPAPTATTLRMVDGGWLAFLYPGSLPGVPRFTSPQHLNRMATIGPDGRQCDALPYSLAEPSVPVLIDTGQRVYLEQLVEITGTLVPLDPLIESEILRSSADFVRLYYHGFFREQVFPDHGFMLDCRTQAGGRLRPVGEPRPFGVNIGAEIGFDTTLNESEFEAALTDVLQSLPPNPRPRGTATARYQPAFSQPGGYRTVQFPKGPLVLHVAFEKRALSLTMLTDSTMGFAATGEYFCPTLERFVAELKASDSGLTLQDLFVSDPVLRRVIT